MENYKKIISLALILLVSVAIGSAVALSSSSNSKFHPGGLYADLGDTPGEPSSANHPSQTAQILSSAPRSTARQDLTENCVHSMDYWLHHTEAWPAHVKIGNFNYSKDEQVVANYSRVADIAGYLFIQVNVAYLNYVSGSPTDEIIRKAILDAGAWLEKHPSGSEISVSDQNKGKSLGMTLEDYNNGKLGHSLCANEPTSASFKEVASAAATNIHTGTLTQKPRPFYWIPSVTPKPQQPRPPGSTVSTPTSTLISLQTSITPIVRPTNTPVPPPTATLPPEPSPSETLPTRPPPTLVPPPTDTPLSPPTATSPPQPAPTSVPLPTDTPIPSALATSPPQPSPTKIPKATKAPPPPTRTPNPTATP